MASPSRVALLIGNSDGIGLATTRRLLDEGWRVVGLSRSASPVEHPAYRHHVQDVAADDYRPALEALLQETESPRVLIYCAGIGEEIDPRSFEHEERVFAVNLQGLVRSLAVVVPAMIAAGGGHVIGLSSVADDVSIPTAPSYSASKAGFSAYLDGLAFRLRKEGVSVTNVRFGFVDTKMAQSDWKPMMISPERAATVLLRCIARRPRQVTVPKRGGFLVRLVRWGQRTLIWTGRGPRPPSG